MDHMINWAIRKQRLKTSLFTRFESLLTTRFNITCYYFKYLSKSKSIDYKYRIEFVFFECSECHMQMPRAQQPTKLGKNHCHPLTIPFSNGIVFQGDKLLMYRKVFLFLSPYRLKKYFVDSWCSKMNRLSILMFELTVFAFKKKVVEEYCFPLFQPTHLLPDASSNFWPLAIREVHTLMFDCYLKLIFSISYSATLWASQAYSHQLAEVPGATAATQTAQLPLNKKQLITSNYVTINLKGRNSNNETTTSLSGKKKKHGDFIISLESLDYLPFSLIDSSPNQDLILFNALHDAESTAGRSCTH